MKKAAYTEEVTVEKVTFSEDEKKLLKNGKPEAGSSLRRTVEKVGKKEQETFSRSVRVGNTMERLEEGQVVITFKDGRSKVLSAEEAKEQLVEIKEKKGEGSVTDSNTARGILPMTDGTQKILTPDQTAELAGPADEENAKANGDK